MLLVGVCVLTFAAMVFFAEKVRMLYTLPKKTLLIFQDIVFGLDFIHDKSGPPCWLLDIS